MVTRAYRAVRRQPRDCGVLAGTIVYRNLTIEPWEPANVKTWYSALMPKATITLSYEEALYVADLLAVAADAASNDEDVPDTFPDEARLAINLILSRTDD